MARKHSNDFERQRHKLEDAIIARIDRQRIMKLSNPESSKIITILEYLKINQPAVCWQLAHMAGL